jgi:hypothetical protein
MPKEGLFDMSFCSIRPVNGQTTGIPCGENVISSLDSKTGNTASTLVEGGILLFMVVLVFFLGVVFDKTSVW